MQHLHGCNKEIVYHSLNNENTSKVHYQGSRSKGNKHIIDGDFVQCYLHLNNTNVTDEFAETKRGGERGKGRKEIERVSTKQGRERGREKECRDTAGTKVVGTQR